MSNSTYSPYMPNYLTPSYLTMAPQHLGPFRPYAAPYAPLPAKAPAFHAASAPNLPPHGLAPRPALPPGTAIPPAHKDAARSPQTPPSIHGGLGSDDVPSCPPPLTFSRTVPASPVTTHSPHPSTLTGLAGHTSAPIGCSQPSSATVSGSFVPSPLSGQSYQSSVSTPLAGQPRGAAQGAPHDADAAGKRAQVKVACTNCQKACKKCSDERPCTRCVRLGLPACVNATRKPRKFGFKRGPYKRRPIFGKETDPLASFPGHPSLRSESVRPPHFEGPANGMAQTSEGPQFAVQPQATASTADRLQHLLHHLRGTGAAPPVVNATKIADPAALGGSKGVSRPDGAPQAFGIPGLSIPMNWSELKGWQEVYRQLVRAKEQREQEQRWLQSGPAGSVMAGQVSQPGTAFAAGDTRAAKRMRDPDPPRQIHPVRAHPTAGYRSWADRSLKSADTSQHMSSPFHSQRTPFPAIKHLTGQENAVHQPQLSTTELASPVLLRALARARMGTGEQWINGERRKSLITLPHGNLEDKSPLVSSQQATLSHPQQLLARSWPKGATQVSTGQQQHHSPLSLMPGMQKIPELGAELAGIRCRPSMHQDPFSRAVSPIHGTLHKALSGVLGDRWMGEQDMLSSRTQTQPLSDSSFADDEGVKDQSDPVPAFFTDPFASSTPASDGSTIPPSVGLQQDHQSPLSISTVPSSQTVTGPFVPLFTSASDPTLPAHEHDLAQITPSASPLKVKQRVHPPNLVTLMGLCSAPPSPAMPHMSVTATAQSY